MKTSKTPSPAIRKALLIEYCKDKTNVRLRNKVVEANRGLVFGVMRYYHFPEVLRDDMFQQGFLGLMRAAQDYDITKNVPFSTYACLWIRAELQRFLANENAEVYGLTQRSALIKQKLALPLAALDAPVAKRGFGTEEIELHELVADASQDVHKKVSDKIAEKSFAELVRQVASKFKDKRYGEIAEARFLSEDPVSLKELGEKYGVSRERIRQMEKSLREKLALKTGHLLGA